jgi:6-phosphogluconate dehydrogenase (decarboxylating)
MQIAIIGLGRMGKNIVYHRLEQGVSVVAYNRSRDDVDEVVAAGAIGAYTLAELAEKLAAGPATLQPQNQPTTFRQPDCQKVHKG